MPRSLVFSYYWLSMAFDGLAGLYGKRYDCNDLASQTYAHLKSTTMEDIFQGGLHEFLRDFMDNNNQLAASIARNFNFP